VPRQSHTKLGIALVVFGIVFLGLGVWFMMTSPYAAVSHGRGAGGPGAIGLVIGLTMIVCGVMVLCGC
jgi:hypothetical protein